MTNLLSDYLNQETMRAKVKVENWQQAGKIAGKLLIEKGIIKPEYIQAMLEQVIEKGPYIVVAPGIAMFHARPEDGVNSIGLSLITPQDGVIFNAGKKDPVKLIFVLAAIDNNSHVELISDLTRLLRNEAVQEKMIKADTVEQLVELIQDYENIKEEKRC